eukprot:5979854-Pyramimonas_sp.AAC.1
MFCERSTCWVCVRGPPRHLIADQEGALKSDEARLDCDQHQIQRRAKTVGSRAVIVERHHEVARNTVI